MSATRDKSQKTTFVYSNLYQIYRKGKEAAKNSSPNMAGVTPAVPPQFSGDPSLLLDMDPIAVSPGLTQGTVLKAGNLAPAEKVQTKVELKVQVEAPAPAPTVAEYRPTEFIGKRLAKPKAVTNNPAIQSLKDNLKNLNDLHARLRFMLQELEELSKK